MFPTPTLKQRATILSGRSRRYLGIGLGLTQEGCLGEGAKGVSYFAHSGLCNRLRAHLIAGVIARTSGRSLALSWNRNPHCGVVAADIFPLNPGRRIRGFGRVCRHPGDEMADTEAAVAPRSHRLLFDETWQYTDSVAMGGVDRASDVPSGRSGCHYLAQEGPLAHFLQRRHPAVLRPSHRCAHPERDFAPIGMPARDNAVYLDLMAETPTARFGISSDDDSPPLSDFVSAFGERSLRIPMAPGERHSREGVRKAVHDPFSPFTCQRRLLTGVSSISERVMQLGGHEQAVFACPTAESKP